MISMPLSRKQLAVSCIIVLLCTVGDKNSENQTNDLAAAICDNVTHALIGAMTYIGAFITRTSNADFYFFLEIILCTICSSVVDADHFAAAKSLHLKDATNLKNRPFMHCTTLILLIVLSVLLLGYITKMSWLCKFGWILAAAFISHHIRDSKRRGFWMWPFGHTKPIHTAVYLIAQMFYPHVLFGNCVTDEWGNEITEKISWVCNISQLGWCCWVRVLLEQEHSRSNLKKYSMF